MIKSLTVEQFEEQFNNAPLELYEFAEEASKIDNCDELKLAAEKYLRSKDEFENMLEQYNVEQG